MSGSPGKPAPASEDPPSPGRILVIGRGPKPLREEVGRFLAGAPPGVSVLHQDRVATGDAALADSDAILVCHPAGRRSGVALAAAVAGSGRAGPTVLLAAAAGPALRRRAAEAGVALCIAPGDLSWPLLRQAIDLRRAEARLAALHRDRTRLLDRLSDAVLDLDADGRVRACNPAVAGLLGWSEADLQGRSAALLLPHRRPDDDRRAERLRRLLERLRRHAARSSAGAARWWSIRLRHKEGLLLPLELQVMTAGGPSDGLTCLLREGAAGAGWRWGPRSFQLVVEHSPAGVLVTDRQGRIEYANPRFCELSGWAMRDLRGRTPKLLGSGETSREVYDELWRTIHGGRVWQGILRNRHRDGSLYWTENRIAPIRDAQGQITHFVAIEEDVTAAKERESALQRSKAQAEAASMAKSMLLAHVSHELRTPMNAIIGFSQLMAAETFGPIGRRYQDYAADILQAGRHLLSVIEDLLDLSRIEAGGADLDDSLFTPAEQVQACLRMVMPRLRAGGQRLAVDLQPDLPRLRGDPLRFRQILLNLLSNSLKFTPPEGEIAVRLSLRWPVPEPCACRQAGMAGAPVRPVGLDLVVQDTGPGMTEREVALARIPFALVDDPMTRRHGGAGLGLSLASALAERHDGSLVIDSAAGRGTTVIVRFPASRLDF